jgi:hypothetical protein
MNENICSFIVESTQSTVNKSIAPTHKKIPPNGAKITSCFVITICLTPKITPKPPIITDIKAGNSSSVSLGAVFAIAKIILKKTTKKEYLLPISGNG